VNSLGHRSLAPGSGHCALPHQCADLTHLCGPVAERNVISFAIGPVFQCVAAQ